eukprot:gene9894-10942_t
MPDIILRVKTNIGSKRVVVSDQATVAELISAIIDQVHVINSRTLSLGLDISGTIQLNDPRKNLSELGLVSGSEIYILEKLVKEVVSKAFVNDRQEVVPAGEYWKVVQESPQPVHAPQHLPSPVKGKESIADARKEDEKRQEVQEETTLYKTSRYNTEEEDETDGLQDIWQDLVNEEETLRAPDEARRMTLIDSANTASQLSQQEREELAALEQTLREAGLMEYAIIQEVENHRDFLLAQRLAREAQNGPRFPTMTSLDELTRRIDNFHSSSHPPLKLKSYGSSHSRGQNDEVHSNPPRTLPPRMDSAPSAVSRSSAATMAAQLQSTLKGPALEPSDYDFSDENVDEPSATRELPASRRHAKLSLEGSGYVPFSAMQQTKEVKGTWLSQKNKVQLPNGINVKDIKAIPGKRYHPCPDPKAVSEKTPTLSTVSRIMSQAGPSDAQGGTKKPFPAPAPAPRSTTSAATSVPPYVPSFGVVAGKPLRHPEAERQRHNSSDVGQPPVSQRPSNGEGAIGESREGRGPSSESNAVRRPLLSNATAVTNKEGANGDGPVRPFRGQQRHRFVREVRPAPSHAKKQEEDDEALARELQRIENEEEMKQEVRDGGGGLVRDVARGAADGRRRQLQDHLYRGQPLPRPIQNEVNASLEQELLDLAIAQSLQEAEDSLEEEQLPPRRQPQQPQQQRQPPPHALRFAADRRDLNPFIDEDRNDELAAAAMCEYDEEDELLARALQESLNAAD